MHRTNLIQLLSSYHPDNQAEQQFKQRTLDFVAQNVDCFERSLAVGHVTASCWLVNPDNTKALLLHHMKLDRWFQLGGHCDGESNVLAVAIKEAQEESGIINIVPVSNGIFDIDVHLIPANSKEAAHDHYDIRFLLKVVGDDTVTTNRESKELRWIGKHASDLPTDMPSVVRMHQKWVNQ